MFTNTIGWVFGRYSAHSVSTVVYRGTATAHGAYSAHSTSQGGYSTVTPSSTVVSITLPDGTRAYTTTAYTRPKVEPLPAGWTRGIDPIKGIFVYERITGPRTFERTYTRPTV